MQEIPLTRANQFVQVANALDALGLAPDRIVRQAGLPPWHLHRPEDLIPSSHIYLLLSHGARAAGNENFGLHVGVTGSWVDLGKVGNRVGEAVTLYDALGRVCRLMAHHTSAARFWLSEVDSGIWLCRRQVRCPDDGLRQMEQYALMMLVRLVQRGAGPSWKPSKILLQSKASPRLEETEQLAGTDIGYRHPAMAIAVPRSILSRPLGPSEPPKTEFGIELRSQPTIADDWVGAITQIITTLLYDGYPTIQSVAEIAEYSVRTLQRRLAEEGLDYSQLVERSRFQSARDLLTNSGISVTDTAFELGYSDVASFSRAFRRWAGVSPRDFRHQHWQ